MNVNKVYLVKIYVKTAEKYIPIDENVFSIFDYRTESTGTFVKMALVYKSSSKSIISYIDLESKEKYDTFSAEDASLGELYISLNDGMVPLRKLFETKEKNISKRKILKKYNEIMKE